MSGRPPAVRCSSSHCICCAPRATVRCSSASYICCAPALPHAWHPCSRLRIAPQPLAASRPPHVSPRQAPTCASWLSRSIMSGSLSLRDMRDMRPEASSASDSRSGISTWGEGPAGAPLSGRKEGKKMPWAWIEGSASAPRSEPAQQHLQRARAAAIAGRKVAAALAGLGQSRGLAAGRGGAIGRAAAAGLLSSPRCSTTGSGTEPNQIHFTQLPRCRTSLRLRCQQAGRLPNPTHATPPSSGAKNKRSRHPPRPAPQLLHRPPPAPPALGSAAAAQ